VGVPSRICDLVQHFRQHIDSFKGSNYNETRARIEFIDPFFKELGWDIDNTQGFAEAYKDVIHEDAIKVEGSTKAPDYSFRIGGQRKFFLEAKKPAVNVKDDIAPAYQLRRYAWNAGLPVSILTDFEEFAIYDTTIRPNLKDKASTARIFYCTYEEYTEKWDYIASILSKDAILKGSFDQFLKDPKKKKGTTAVDKEFLKEMEKWRTALAKNIALRNTIDIHALNYVVQATIDRILFLRICEDRNIEEYGRLQKLAGATNIYKKLTELFQQADEKYNSGLFHFRKEKDIASAPDEISLRLKIDDKILKEIITALYYPSPYEFSVISADILGNVYEQFLGKVIRLTASGQAKVEEKPEVKKAGGVYYTPQYIVKYIVENTVGELLKGKTPMMVAGKVKGHTPLRILDPACGSGSFLIYAYQYLLDWHRDWYEKDIKQKGAAQAKKWRDEVYQGPGNHWYLTTREKKRILLNNIFGVDIDHQAVEVTKLNLLLKVLEGENRETLGTNLKLFQERALPDLSGNVKCGNTLISDAFFKTNNAGQRDLFTLDEEDKYRINAFNWRIEFESISADNGFDVIMGNPPWGAEFSMEEKSFLMKEHEEIHMRTPDSFNYFLGKAYEMARQSGLVTFIIPSTFIFQHEYANARRFFLNSLQRVINLGDNIFEVTAPSCIVQIKKGEKLSHLHIADFRNISRNELPEQLANPKYYRVLTKEVFDTPDYVIPMNPRSNRLLLKILKSNPLTISDIAMEVSSGIGTGGDKIFRIKKSEARKLKIEEDILFPVLTGRDFHAYDVPEDIDFFVIYSTKQVNKKTHPNTLRYLAPYEKQLSQKREAKKGMIPWWALHWPRNPGLFKAPKIILRQTSNTLIAGADLTGFFCLNSIIIIQLKDITDLSIVVGLLNSKLLRWIYANLTQENNRVFAEVKPINLRKLPIPNDLGRLKELEKLVKERSLLTKKSHNVATPDEKKRIGRQIEILDNEVDRVVFKAYGLNGDEIKIVEGHT
jgi:type I restriction-modification system DNA methylase subunit